MHRSAWIVRHVGALVSGLGVLPLVAAAQPPAETAAQLAADRAEARARGYDGFLTAGHFAVAWRLEEGGETEVRALLDVAERFYARLAAIVGETRTPTRPILLVLAGHAQAPDGTWRAPSVDRRGRVILLRYADGIAAYRQEITHELVHAFRRHAGYWFSGFLEEGFAEAVAMEVDPEEVGFPRYGYPLVVAAGQLLARGQYLPFAEVRDRHDDLNRRCQLQAYLERASFFDYLKRIAGLDALVAFAYGETDPSDADYRRVFGAPFAELVAAWESALRADFAATPDAVAIAERYRAEPPIASRPIC